VLEPAGVDGLRAVAAAAAPAVAAADDLRVLADGSESEVPSRFNLGVLPFKPGAIRLL